MKLSNKILSCEFDSNTGNLHIKSKNITLTPYLIRDDFLNLNPDIFGSENSSTALTYYFNAPVNIWTRQFMLSVSFFPYTSPYCSAYGLEPLFEINRTPYDVTKNEKDFDDLKALLNITFNRPPRIISEIKRAIWDFNWGLVSIGSVIQNSSPVAISVGWTSRKK